MGEWLELSDAIPNLHRRQTSFVCEEHAHRPVQPAPAELMVQKSVVVEPWSWVTYGLGTENDLPGFVVDSSGGKPNGEQVVSDQVFAECVSRGCVAQKVIGTLRVELMANRLRRKSLDALNEQPIHRRTR